MIKNDLFLRALAGESVERPPVWMMRQAGRYLPDFMKLKAKYDFFTRCKTPELASEITVMPVDQIGVDAAILFSDILVIPQAMGIDLDIITGLGPKIDNPIRTAKQVDELPDVDTNHALQYVFDAIKMTKQILNDEVPLIGFAGSPWTIFCYVVEGQGSKTFNTAKEFCFTQPEAAHKLLQKITDATIIYLEEKVRSGVNAIQVFDSWGGMLSPEDYQLFSMQYINQITARLNLMIPTIVFGKGCWFALEDYSKTGVSALGVDWTVSPETARKLTNNSITLQGNFDPARLLSPIPEIKSMVKTMIDRFGKDKFIANLGHGILPHIPVDHAKAFVDAVKSYQG
jgi:uroporphyrinogen decarboxylase